MKEEEKRLLLMVAKDLRRVWSNYPGTFGPSVGWIAGDERMRSYDDAIAEVENGKGCETKPGDCSSSS